MNEINDSVSKTDYDQSEANVRKKAGIYAGLAATMLIGLEGIIIAEQGITSDRSLLVLGGAALIGTRAAYNYHKSGQQG